MRWTCTLLMLLTACAATVPSPGGHETVACSMHEDDRAPGWTIYVCPRPFPSKRFHRSCAFTTRESADGKGPFVGCGWTAGFTDVRAREIYVYDVYLPEALDHELLHARGLIGEDD